MAHCKIKVVVFILACFVASCTHHSRYVDITGSNYPKDIAAIILNKCAVSGCHNELSYINADELNLASWDHLFEGSETGSVVIPFRSDFSSLCYFTNTFSDQGIALEPTMPFGNPPLSKSEYTKLRDWINSGAPSLNGKVKFSDNPLREKFYVSNRLCNVVTVIDAESLLQMRYIDVGDKSAQFPYCIKVAPDKKYWYVSFYTQTNIVQKFSAEDDKPAGQINLGAGVWTTFTITADSHYAWFVDNSSIGKIAYVDLQEMEIIATYSFGGMLNYPRGIAINETFKKLYIGAAQGNFVYNIDINDPLNPSINEMSIDGKNVIHHQSLLDPIELLADHQSNKCYIACEKSGELIVFDMEQDSLLSVVKLGTNPACLELSPQHRKLFVSCPDDTASFAGNRGAVYVIDPAINTIVSKIKTGYQPFGIAVNDNRGVAAVVNANISSAGPASHHSSGCGSKNGNVVFIDLNTLGLISDKLLEVAVFPSAAAAR